MFRKVLPSAIFIASFLFFSFQVFAQAPANDLCANAVLITSSNSCTSTNNNLSGTLSNATFTNATTGSCGNKNIDVWYRLVANSSAPTITLTSTDANIRFQLYSGVCNTLASILCSTSPSQTITSSLTIGSTYLIRVHTSSNTSGGFTICVKDEPPVNDGCSGATLLTLGTTNTNGTVSLATPSGVSNMCATGNPDDDVWYSFVADAANATVTLSALGSDLSASGARLQLFSGTCNALNSLACGTTTLNATGLIYRTTYFIRVYSAGTSPIGNAVGGSGFSITVNNTSTALAEYNITSGRMNEVFKQTILSPANGMNNPWEITYGADGFLWITESRGYKLYRMNPATGNKTTVLDVSQGATGYLTAAEHSAFNVQFTQASLNTLSANLWPQGGFAGLALHPKFMDPVTPVPFVYISYVHTYNSGAGGTGGVFFTNRIVRFTYNTTTNKLESPISLCDTLPGSSDHNSQRMIIAPVDGIDYLFYASGDMGSGQFGNAARPIKSQITASYEGKTLRFNLEPDTDAGTLDKWIPNNNPYNATAQSAVWNTGMRNNQGFAFGNINGTNYLYGSSHGPFSDDEINIIEANKNYGHPLVIGYSADGNYDGSKAGSGTGSLPLINSEVANATAIGASYKDPIFSAYAAPKGTPTTIGTIQYIYNQFNNGNGANAGWPSEGWSGMDLYTNTFIPGWKNSLVIGSLKWGRVIRLKLNNLGTGVLPINGGDTVSYFGSTNRYRDVAYAPNGKDLFVIMDMSSTTSGPSAANPVAPACPGCVQKYSFLGYNDNAGRSTMPNYIDVTPGVASTCTNATTVTIDASNNNIWVPITGPDGNIMAEIKANGNNLGTVTSSFYINNGAIREDNSRRTYANRNITITPQNQPTSTVNVRLYLTAAELIALRDGKNSVGDVSGITNISNVAVFKNNDACGAAMATAAPRVSTTFPEPFGNNFVITANITSFSSFYFGNNTFTTLPLKLIYFKGNWQNGAALLQWQTTSEVNTAHFIVERSIDNQNYEGIKTILANGNSSVAINYATTDNNAASQPVTLIYYRLKMVDKDGKTTYSKVITLHNKPMPYTVAVYPNPINDVLKVNLFMQTGTDVRLQVTDLQGRVIYTAAKVAPAGQSTITVDARSWKPQLYILKVTNSKNEVLSVQKFEKF